VGLFLTQLSILGAIGGVLLTVAPFQALFDAHPSAVAVAFLLLMPEAIMLLRRNGSLQRHLGRKRAIRLHFGLQALAVVFVMVGVGAIYLNKERHGKPHFVSWHGTLGIIAAGSLGVHFLCSIIFLFPTQAQHAAKRLGSGLHGWHRRHRQASIVIYSVGIGATLLGFLSNYWTKQLANDPFIWWCITGATTVIYVCIAWQVLQQ